MPKFDSSVTAPAFKEATKETPDQFAQTLLVVPLSLGVGFCVFWGWLFVCWGVGWPADSAKVIGGAITGITALYGWWRIWEEELYMATETITGHDLNGDGWIGEPPAPGEYKITIEEGPTQTRYLPMQSEAEREKMWRVARMICNGTPFSEGALTGTNRPLSRSEFLNFRDMLMARGYLAWKDKRHKTLGCEFTVKGMSVMHNIASTTPPRMRTQGSQNALPAGQVGEWEEADNV